MLRIILKLFSGSQAVYTNLEGHEFAGKTATGFLLSVTRLEIYDGDHRWIVQSHYIYCTRNQEVFLPE